MSIQKPINTVVYEYIHFFIHTNTYTLSIYKNKPIHTYIA